MTSSRHEEWMRSDARNHLTERILRAKGESRTEWAEYLTAADAFVSALDDSDVVPPEVRERYQAARAVVMHRMSLAEYDTTLMRIAEHAQLRALA
jgi:hypothetical protein